MGLAEVVGETYAIVEASMISDGGRLDPDYLKAAAKDPMQGLGDVTNLKVRHAVGGYYDVMIAWVLDRIDYHWMMHHKLSTPEEQLAFYEAYNAKRHDMDTDTMTVQEAAESLEVSERRIYALLKEQEIVRSWSGKDLYAKSVAAYKDKRGDKKGGPYKVKGTVGERRSDFDCAKISLVFMANPRLPAKMWDYAAPLYHVLDANRTVKILSEMKPYLTKKDYNQLVDITLS